MSTPSRILVVDDDASLLGSLASILSDCGYVVSQARNGAEAWEKIAAEPFDFVLSDIEMPMMSGIELCHKVARNYPDLPIALMSGLTLEERMKESLPVYAVLKKPLWINEFVRVIQSKLGVPQVGRVSA